LPAGVPARGDDERDEQREDHRAIDLSLEATQRARRQHLADEERHEPAGALLQHAEDADLHVRLLERLHAGELVDVLRLLGDDRIDDVVDGDDAEHVALVVDDRDGEEVVLLDETCDFLAVDERADADRLPHVADVRDATGAVGADQLAQGDDVGEPLAVGLQHEDGIDGLLRAADAAHVEERLLDVP
jgi:hypothetical protein